MAEARRRGCDISFDVLYCAERRGRPNQLLEIGEKEGEYIRQYNPILNTQIPKEENWRSYTVNRGALNISLDDIMEGEYI